MSKSTPSVQRGTKVATGQFLYTVYSLICHQKKGIKMLLQHVSSNIRASGKELPYFTTILLWTFSAC